MRGIYILIVILCSLVLLAMWLSGAAFTKKQKPVHKGPKPGLEVLEHYSAFSFRKLAQFICGEIKNNTHAPFQKVEIQVTLFDKEDQRIDVIKEVLLDLKPNEVRTFTMYLSAKNHMTRRYDIALKGHQKSEKS